MMFQRLISILLLLCIASLARADLLSFGAKKPAFLPADQAFSLEVNALDPHTLLASFKVTPEYYLYRDKISFSVSGGGPKVVGINLPKGEIKNDSNFGAVEVYHQSFQAEIKLEPNHTSKSLEIHVGYQGCSDKGLCYPPLEKVFNVNLDQVVSAEPAALPVKIENENTQIAKLLQGGSFWLIVSSFFAAGIVLAFSPCTYPMIPILSGIIVGRGHKITHFHAFILSLAYVFGMALTYALAGIAAGFSGELISNAMQTPAVLGSFAGLLVLLSLSMFGFYELQLPSALQSRLSDSSNKLHGGHVSGVFAMGALSAIIVSPCVAAPMAGALIYIGQTHDALLGGAALFAMALGMGSPLMLIGGSAGSWLPKAGAWMEAVKRFFGVLMLAMAIWMISPVIAVGVQMLLWAALLIFSAIYLRALDSLPHNAHGLNKFGKGVGVLALLLGVAFLIGALSGARDILRPLGNIGRSTADASSTIRFERVKSLAELERLIAQARGKTVMLDFYADWCTDCKTMERFTFSDAGVQGRLKNAILLQADVTANNAEDKMLLSRFQLFGPPAILFFDSQGKELTDFRVVGYQDATQFGDSLQHVGL